MGRVYFVLKFVMEAESALVDRSRLQALLTLLRLSRLDLAKV